MIDAGLKSGNPFFGYCYQNGDSGVDGQLQTDHLALMCRTIYRFVRMSLPDNPDQWRINLVRSDEDGTVVYPNDGLPWWKIQLDSCTGDYFCASQATRDERMRARIATMKAFWDMANVLRGRRLERLAGHASQRIRQAATVISESS